MSHLDEDALLRFVQHQLSPEALAQAEAHLRTCNLCRRAVALLAETEAPASEPSPPAPPPPELSAKRPSGARPALRGKQIDRYVVLEVLGAGSMGIVYAAFDPQLDRKIALKMLAGDSADQASDTEKRARMMREAQAMARLSHPNVVHVHDVGTFQDQIFVAMEFVQGQSLKKWLESGRRTWREVLRVLIRAGRGLAAAHAAGLVHRDFKPDNVMVGNDGVARVMDFGLVSSVAGDPNAWKTPAPLPLDRGSEADLTAPLTRTGVLLGTPAYMAPEQWMGDKIDHRADQFSFCVSLYEALYGQRPFEAKTLSELTSKVAQGRIREVPPGSPVPFYIRRAVVRGLAADPAQRYPSMKKLLEVLELGLRVPRRRVLFGAGAAALLAVGGLWWPGLWRQRSPERCGRAADAFSAAWDEPRQRALAGAFLGAGGPAAAEAWVHAERLIDRFRDRWIASRDRACRAEDAPPALTSARVDCLDRQLDELRALEEVLGKPDGRVIRDAALAAAGLPSPEDCASQRDLGAGLADGPGRDLRRQLSGARATLAAGSPAEARRMAADALERARRMNRALEAEALLALGAAEVALGDGARAQVTLGQAMVAAQAAGHARAGAEAAVALAELLAPHAPPEHAEFLASLAAAELDRLGEDGPLRARVELANARRFLKAGRADAAEAPARRALGALRRVHGEEHPAVAEALALLGRAKRARGQVKEALAEYRAAVRALEQSLGRSHPKVAGALVAEADAQLALGDARAAVALCERAVELARSGGDGGALAEAKALLTSALASARRGAQPQ